LCPDSNSVATSSSEVNDNDSLAHEAASTEAICPCAGMSVSADETSQIREIAADTRTETISPGQFSRPRKLKSARIDDTTPMAMAEMDVVLSDDVLISQAGPAKAEVGSAEVARTEPGSSDEDSSSAADPYARPRGFKTARFGGAETIFQITIPAAPVTFKILLPGDVDPRDKMLTGPNLPTTPGNSESMGTPTAEPQAVSRGEDEER
jgi:hypothetical protein